MSYKTILVTEDDGVKTIMLNRPARRNAMTPEMQDELIAALERAATGHCRVVVITGAGEAFCAGLDLQHLQAISDKSQAEHVADAERLTRLFRTLYELPKPTIAVVQGAAVAGGTGLATICDFTLAAHGVKFGFTEVKIGFVPALVSAFLALQIGDKRAKGLLLTGRLFSSEEAEQMGLVNEVVAAEELAERAGVLAAQLKANSPQSMAATKKLMAKQNEAWLDAALTHAMTANAEGRGMHDFREGVAAFLEKRPPVWGR
ncbi:MAG: enoyl-CoA hydratase-related protein [Edaphobacter sp.]|uniref:enoyl-CoA hydratase/isomerase family protein n=1 Tax=Edaphobacter sp. TaxID=1934404 RepID=UPI002396E00B|nr:enoyl-CoA hydratase-related protein [Edaphobacter sp.]MDE1176228.1 enoyl-CoA hydratase-related protein [Edaphobacter sp.]